MVSHLKRYILFVILILSIISSSAFCKEFSFHYQKIVVVPENFNLELNYVNGNLIVKRGETSKLVIEAIKKVNASNREEAEEVADHIEIVVSHQGKDVRVKTNYLRMLNRSQSFWKKILGFGGDSYGDVDFVVFVPNNCNIIINGQSGNIEIMENSGSVEITSASSSTIIVSDNHGPVTINTESADIFLSSINGKINVKNSQGNTSAEFIIGGATVRQTRGKIKLHWIEGDIKVKTKSAKIDIKQLNGSIDLVAGSGSVKIETEMVSSNTYHVETTTGQISFNIPFSASGRLKIETLSGEIRSEVPISVHSMSRQRLTGQFGEGGTRIVLTSSTGDVSIAQY